MKKNKNNINQYPYGRQIQTPFNYNNRSMQSVNRRPSPSTRYMQSTSPSYRRPSPSTRHMQSASPSYRRPSPSTQYMQSASYRRPSPSTHYAKSASPSYNSRPKSYKNIPSGGKKKQKVVIGASILVIAIIGFYNIFNIINQPSTNNQVDNVALITQIISPTSGSTVSGTTLISISTTDNVEVSKVEIYIDNNLIITDTSLPYNYNWDTTSYTDGSREIKVIAYDAKGNNDIEKISVIVNNGGGPNDVKKYAVLVGISDYKAISDLSYCDEDASDWYNFLIGSTMNFDEVWVYGDGHSGNYPKYDGKATESNVKAALQNMISMADNNDIIMFTTSGHGSGNGNGKSYLCMWDDGAGENGEDGSMYDTELANILDDAVADKIHVFIDHCYAGGFGPDLMGMGNSQNVYLTTTCTEDGYGYDDPSHNNGAWTYYFLDYSWETHFGGSATTSLENIFDYAHTEYVKHYSGGDECEEYDGNPSQAFYLN